MTIGQPGNHEKEPCHEHSPFKVALLEAAGDLPSGSTIVSPQEVPGKLAELGQQYGGLNNVAISFERLPNGSYEITFVRSRE